MKPSQISFYLVLGASLTAFAPGQTKDFYTRRLEVMGIEIKAPEPVDSRALTAAKRTIERMLAAQPEIAKRMRVQRAALAIIPRKAFITSLPEFSAQRGKNDSNGNPYDSFKVRGAGGVPGQPVTATSEENLLRLSGDPFAAEDITCHEFAHAVMNLGFTEEQRRKWKELYTRAKEKNLFTGTFAMTNADEYWAELSQSYFGVNNESNSPGTIRRADPDAFVFLESVYGPVNSRGAPMKR
jgi:alpha-glucosidase